MIQMRIGDIFSAGDAARPATKYKIDGRTEEEEMKEKLVLQKNSEVGQSAVYRAGKKGCDRKQTTP
jgi:hypothetical protein